MTFPTENLLEIVARLGIIPQDITLYQTACIHRSFLNESDKTVKEHNERLEFLWDAALQLAMTDLIFQKYPDRDEGWMTDFRSGYVRGAHLAELSLQYGLDEVLQMSLGERRAGGRNKPNILADMFEAILGALYLDQGFEVTREVINTIVFGSSKVRVETKDAKSQLQEIVQKYLVETPLYTILDESGKDHEKSFTISVSVQWVDIGLGVGTNKKKAQEWAAENALVNQDNWIHLLWEQKG